MEETKFQSSTMAYLDELEEEQLKRLHELYLLDFEMFGYSPYVYYD